MLVPVISFIQTLFGSSESHFAEAQQFVWTAVVSQILAATSACLGGIFSICRGTAGTQNMSVFEFMSSPLSVTFIFKITNHEEVISQSLCEEDTKAKVVSYLSKVMDADL